MIRLRCNGRIMEVGGSEVVAELERHVIIWNAETSGWDSHGNFWSVDELPDVLEYDPFDTRIAARERAADGACAVCGRRHRHSDDCATFNRRRGTIQ